MTQASWRDSWRERWKLSSSNFNNPAFQSFRGLQRSPQQYLTQYQSDPALSQHFHNLQIQNHLPLLSYVEKSLLLLDFFQIFGLLWNAAQPWPWPYLWIIYTRGINYFNIDYFSMTEDGALAGKSANTSISAWGEMENYYIYVSVFAAFSFGLSCFFLYYCYYNVPYGELPKPFHATLVACGYLLVYIFYLPCLLAVSRIYYCETNITVEIIGGVDTVIKEFVLAADPSVTCLSIEHILLLVFCTLAILPMTFLIPYLACAQIHKELVYIYNKHDHEKYIQLYEILYVWDIAKEYLENKLYLLASFRLPSVYFYGHVCLLKFLLVCCFIIFRYQLTTQAFLMLFCIAVFVLYYSLFRGMPFRNRFSNVLFMTLYLLLFMNVSYGFVNSCQIQNLFTTMSIEFYFLMITHFLAFVGIAFLLGYIVFYRQVVDWPSLSTILAIYDNPKWLTKISIWMMILREVQFMKVHNMLVPMETMNTEEVGYYIQALSLANKQAKKMNSLFESYLNLQLEELLVIFSTREPFAIRKLDHWNEAFLNAVAQPRKISSSPTAGNNASNAIMNNGGRSLTDPAGAGSNNGRPTSASNGRPSSATAGIIASRRHSQTNVRFHSTISDSSNANNTTNSKENVFHRHSAHATLMTEKKKRILLKLFAYSTIVHCSNKNQKKHHYRMKFDIKNYKNYLDELVNGKSRSNKDTINFRQFHHLYAEDEEKVFDQEMIEEAKKMIARLQERSELALNKHHLAAKHIYEQQKQRLLASLQQQQANKSANQATSTVQGSNKSFNSAHRGSTIAMHQSMSNLLTYQLANPNDMQNSMSSFRHQQAAAAAGIIASSSYGQAYSSSNQLMGQKSTLMNIGTQHGSFSHLGLNRIATMELLKETVDDEEQKDLEDLYLLWDEAILLYEQEEFPADYSELNRTVENWYVYRELISKRLEIIFDMLEEQAAILENLADAEVIEEGEDESSDEDENDANRNKYQIIQQNKKQYLQQLDEGDEESVSPQANFSNNAPKSLQRKTASLQSVQKGLIEDENDDEFHDEEEGLLYHHNSDDDETGERGLLSDDEEGEETVVRGLLSDDEDDKILHPRKLSSSMQKYDSENPQKKFK